MLAASFIIVNLGRLGLGNLGLIVAGVLLALACMAAAGGVLKQGSNGEYALVFAGFGVFFFVFLCIIAPHMSSVDHRHHVQVVPDMTREYGSQLKVLDSSVQNHWIRFQLKACGNATYQYDNMRLLGGHYWFAKPVITKDKYGNDTTSYQMIPANKLKTVCATSTLIF